MRKLAAFRKLSSPFVGDKPLDSISLCFYGDSTGIKMWNNPNDPMPIKTTNMAGLQKWEETEDYIIYLCKDATMTTVQNYVTGTFQTFQERISDIESSQELMKSYSIEWTEQDSINLINEINNEALVKLEQSVMMLPVDGENEVQPIVLEPKTVPTTYECCFRMDKKSGEFYIGEGYENLAQPNNCQNHSHNTVSSVDSNGIVTISTMGTTTTQMNGRYGYKTSLLDPSTEYTASIKVIESLKPNDCTLSTLDNSFLNPYDIKLKLNVRTDVTRTSQPSPSGSINQYLSTVGDNEVKMLYQITKTSTPKPFVKSIMPSGKLAFVTGATSETHSFLGKSFNFLKSTDFKGTFLRGVRLGQNGRNEYIKPNKESDVDILVTKNLCKSFDKNIWSLGVIGDSGISTGVRYIASGSYNYDAKSFKQLLIYKGNLSEAELKAENEKDIKIKSNPYDYSIKNIDTKTSEETHYTDYFISHAPNKENIAIFGSDFEAEEKAGVFTLDLNKEINHKDDRTSARLVILP